MWYFWQTWHEQRQRQVKKTGEQTGKGVFSLHLFRLFCFGFFPRSILHGRFETTMLSALLSSIFNKNLHFPIQSSSSSSWLTHAHNKFALNYDGLVIAFAIWIQTDIFLFLSAAVVAIVIRCHRLRPPNEINICEHCLADGRIVVDIVEMKIGRSVLFSIFVSFYVATAIDEMCSLKLRRKYEGKKQISFLGNVTVAVATEISISMSMTWPYVVKMESRMVWISINQSIDKFIVRREFIYESFDWVT